MAPDGNTLYRDTHRKALSMFVILLLGILLAVSWLTRHETARCTPCATPSLGRFVVTPETMRFVGATELAPRFVSLSRGRAG